ncbi:hypothetical protein EWB00_008586 [Schistosoma japonicum]|uniref:Uncharacterized protein n=1 Tax=Schistosoma japonicum TaxID=6182 RepID=A0A4Z2DTC6_SCHJA|nr:hypothetical protein EWB00_008586 [Schistosoma japonicum]
MSVVGQVSNGRDDQVKEEAVAQHSKIILASIFTLLVNVFLLLATTVENNLRNEQQTGCTMVNYRLSACFLEL